jgi:hypothetical protein
LQQATSEEWPTPVDDLDTALHAAYEQAGLSTDMTLHLRRLELYKLLAEELKEAHLMPDQSRHMIGQRALTYAKVGAS